MAVSKRKVVSVKIERVKIRGRFFIVAKEKIITTTKERVNNKFVETEKESIRVVDKKLWSKKFTLKKAKSLFKKNNTLQENIQRVSLKTRPFDEFIDNSKNPTRPRNRPFRFFVSGLLKDGRTVAASSRMQFWESILEAKSEAEKRFFEMLAFTIKDVYDADEGLKLIDNVVSIEKGIKFNR